MLAYQWIGILATLAGRQGVINGCRYVRGFVEDLQLVTQAIQKIRECTHFASCGQLAGRNPLDDQRWAMF